MKEMKQKFKSSPLGPIPEDWQTMRFSELCDITRGASPRPIHDWFADNGIPWIKIADATASDSRFINDTKQYIRPEGKEKSVAVHPGDLILSNSATPGIPKFVNIEACIHDGWLLLKNLRRLDKTFAYYLLINDRPNIVQFGSGSIFTNLKTEILKNHIVSLPPLSEQRRIAEILSSLDDKIELNRKMNKTLESIAQAIFKRWFVDYEFPDKNGKPYKSSGGKMVESELGKIPEGWEATRLETFIEITQGYSFKGKDFSDDGNVMVRMGNFTEDGFLSFNDNNTKYCNANCSGKFLLNHRDLVVCLSDVTQKGRFLGNPGLIPNDGRIYVLNQRVAKIEPVKTEKMFLYYLFRSVEFKEWVVNTANSTTVLNTSSKAINDFKFVLPANVIQRKFSETAESIYSAIEYNIKEIEILSQIRDLLLPRLMSGRVRI